MSTYDTVKRIISKFRIRDPFSFNNVKPSVAYMLIILGLIHFIPNGVAIAKLNRIQFYNWGIYADLGLADSLQMPIMMTVLIFDLMITFFGMYLLKHLEPEHEERKFDFDNTDNMK